MSSEEYWHAVAATLKVLAEKARDEVDRGFTLRMVRQAELIARASREENTPLLETIAGIKYPPGSH